MHIYLPSSNVYNKCYVVQSEGVIRAYDTIPTNNSSYNYRDYYVNSNYIYRDGNGQWSQYSTLPTCLSPDIITTDWFYRNDLSNILIIFTILFLFIIYFPIKIFSRLFGKWLKL